MRPKTTFVCLVLAATFTLHAQQFHTVQVPLAETPLKIVQPTHGETPFTVAGPRGAILGQQNGSFEAWVWPMKLLSNLRITAHLKDYDVPIDINDQAGTIDVRPDRTVITYSHAAIVVRQIMFAPHSSQSGTGAVVLYQVDAVRPGTLTFSFTPELRRMWPAPNYGVPNVEWVAGSAGGGGFYVLHSDTPQIAAALTIPGAVPGVLPPYQEKPKVYPVTMTVSFPAAEKSSVSFPLLMVAANGHVPQAEPASAPATSGMAEAHPLNNSSAATTSALSAALLRLNEDIPRLYTETAEYWRKFLESHLSVETPDKKFNDAVQWAEVSIDQARVLYQPEGKQPETGLTAGYFSSGDSARPGFAWFFGRDSLWTLYAIDSYGDFDLARKEFDFLLARQRADGKIMHEFSQTADEVDWGAMWYEYASADATPLLIMAVEDYINCSGDTAYLQQHWPQILKAWQFETTNDADGDGVYDNSQGTAWVESWPKGMPKQEIYLAALDEQASGAMSRLAAMMADKKLSLEAEARAAKVSATIEHEYAPTYGSEFWAFSWNGEAGQDITATIFPAVAWWDGHYQLLNSEPMFRRWASPEFTTAWGTRNVGKNEKVYDPISYHQGSVWPLYTGWAAMAEYRARKPQAGFEHLMANVGLTCAQDLGAVTELLSGEFYQPMGRSSSHQMWSSAMVLTPAIRGLFGVRIDAEHKTLYVDPQLPPEWRGHTIKLHNVNLAGYPATIELDANGGVGVNRPDGWKLEASKPARK